MTPILLALVIITGASPEKIDLAQSESSVEFLAIGQPSAIKIRGKSTDSKAVHGNLELKGNRLQLSASLALNTLGTGIALRDEHMKEKYLEVQKYPTAELSLSPTTLPTACEQSCDAEIAIEGTLLLHGVQKPVTGKVKLRRSRQDLEALFLFRIALADFGIETPAFMGVRVTRDVAITARVKALTAP